MQKTIWNTIPESAGGQTVPGTAEIYDLRHWQLSDTVDGIVLEGCSHRQAGLPDGMLLCTSIIQSYCLSDGFFYFQTVNHLYRCSLQEYITESGSLCLAENLSVEPLLQQIRDLRSRHFLDLFPDGLSAFAIFMNWYGCEYPYLRWMLRTEKNAVLTGEHISPYYGTEDGPVRLFIENSGYRSLCLPVEDGRYLTVMPETYISLKCTVSSVPHMLH